MGSSVQISGMPGALGQTTGSSGQNSGITSQTPGIPGQTTGTPGLYPGLPSGNGVNNGVSTSKRNSVEGDGSRKSSDVGVEVRTYFTT